MTRDMAYTIIHELDMDLWEPAQHDPVLALVRINLNRAIVELEAAFAQSDADEGVDQ